ncbi:transcobalamin-1-like [Oculina patagonica]
MYCRYLTLLVIIAVFSQAKGFCGSRSLDANLTRAAIRAAEWLRNNHDKNGTYGEGHVNGFAFHALRVVGHNVEHGAAILHAEIIKKGGLSAIPGGPLAVYILGALATCRDPWQFYGLNLVSSLQNQLDKYPLVGLDHPFQFSLAVIALCSAGKDVGQLKYVDYIINNIRNQTTAAHASGDTLAMHIFALTCVEEFITRHAQPKFNLLIRIRGGIVTASKVLLKRQLLDSTFGKNQVTAALSYQGLLAAKVNQIKCSETMKFLLSRQNPDGSFMNLGATIYVLQSLVGALPYDVNKIACPDDKSAAGKDLKIRVCVELVFNATKYTSGRSPPLPACVKVRNGTNAHDILKMAATQDSCFNFTAVMTMWGHSVYSICGLDRRPADKVYWMIYIDGKSARTGIDYLRPGDGSTLVFVYKQLFWRK